MKILQGDDCKPVPFCEIKLGSAFVFRNELYMRMTQTEPYVGSKNAVSLWTGHTISIGDETPVQPVNAEVHYSLKGK